MERVERTVMPFYSDVNVEETTAALSPDVVPIHVTKSSLGTAYMPLLLETMEGIYQQLMDDGLVSEGHVTRWGLVKSCRQRSQVFGNDSAASALSETKTMETTMCQQQD